MHGSHESPLVALSVVIAILASYTALSLAGRVVAARGGARVAWLLGGSVAMGTGIWSMHFVAMLAFHLPVPIAYDVPLVALSLLAAMAVSAFALFVASRDSVGMGRLLAAGTIMGAGIVVMHYTGMAAMRQAAQLGYHFGLVALSGLIAVTASTVALWLAIRLREENSRRGGMLRGGAAVVMGFAIAGLHYTAMAAAQFTAMDTAAAAPRGLRLEASGLAPAVVGATFIILFLALLGAVTDHWVRVKLAGAEALKESEERYRSVVGEVQEVIFRTDAEGRWTFLNPAWTEITGFATEESLGVPFSEFVHEESQAAQRVTFASLTEGGASTVRTEVRYRTKDGGTRWLGVHARANRDAKGALVGTAGTLQDVTERRTAEEELRAAREVAEAASRAKSEFLSRMSHELRTPLNAILGFGQLLEIEELAPESQESVSHILKAGHHLLALINEVLDLTGIESGKLELSQEPVSVVEVSGEAIDLIRPLAAQRNIQIDAGDVMVSGRYVLADRQRLKQVLLNFLANAVKYNRVGGSARVTCEETAEGWLRLAVSDSGPGIPADRMARLFTPFDRLGAEQTGVEGTGLGLALSKRLAEAMGGRIGAHPSARAGSTFWIELPMAESQIARCERLGEATGPVEAPDGARRARVLYVEDNLSNLTLIQRLMARRPTVELIPAMQGGLGLELAWLHKPDLILLDLHLPDISGEDVLRQLRNAAATRDIPVVVVSADATEAQVARLLAAGAHAYLTKPLDVKQFFAVLDAMLAGARAAA